MAPRSSSSARPATSASEVAEELAAERGLDDHPAVRRRPDHRRPGDGRARARRGPAGRRGRPRPDRWRRAGERGRRGDQGAPPGGAGDRRRARARGRRARFAGAWRDRPLAGRAGVPDDRRRDADAGARRADVRAPARLSRFDRHRLRGRDRGRGPAGGRAEPARRRTIGRAGHRGDGVPRARSRAGSESTGRSWPWSAAGTWTRSGIATTSSRRSRRRAEPGHRPGARLAAARASRP